MNRLRTLFGSSVFWLALSMLSGGINTLVRPSLVLGLAPAGGWLVARLRRGRGRSLRLSRSLNGRRH